MTCKALISQIEQNIQSGVLSHAFIVTGGTADDRRILAFDTAAVLLGNNSSENCPDLITVTPDGENIKTDQISELGVALRNKPFSSERLVAIVDRADAMTAHSQNKLLKTLEEPAPGTVMMLLSENPERMLATILSRCVVLRLGSSDNTGVVTEADREFFSDAKTAISIAVQHTRPLAEMFGICDKYATGKPDAECLLSNMENFLRDMVVGIRASELVSDSENIKIAAQLKMNTDKTFRNIIRLIEIAKRDIDRGMNIGYCLRDLGVRIRQEELYGKSS